MKWPHMFSLIRAFHYYFLRRSRVWKWTRHPILSDILLVPLQFGLICTFGDSKVRKW